MFTETVAKKLKNYVYRLIDPRNGETFYVGKGKGNRVFNHIRTELKFSNNENNGNSFEDEISEKYERIRAIRQSGLEVLHVIHRHGLADDIVFEVEAAVMDSYPGISNLQRGHGSSDRGTMHVSEIITKYGLPVFEPEPEDKLVLININRSFEDNSIESLYQQVRYAWRISKTRAEKADYVVAVVKGVIKGVFIAEDWLQANRANFLDFEPIDGRYGFRGKAADNKVWKRLVGEHGKRIENDELKHFQNPIRYWGV